MRPPTPQPSDESSDPGGDESRLTNAAPELEITKDTSPKLKKTEEDKEMADEEDK